MTKKQWANKTYEAEHEVWRWFADHCYDTVNQQPHPAWKRLSIEEIEPVVRLLGVGEEVPVVQKRRRGVYSSFIWPSERWPHGRLVMQFNCPQWIVVHECAHVFAERDGERGHGAIFRGHYLRLIRQFLGEDEAWRMKVAFEVRNMYVVVLR